MNDTTTPRPPGTVIRVRVVPALIAAVSGVAVLLAVLALAHLGDWFAGWRQRRRVDAFMAEDIRAGGGGW